MLAIQMTSIAASRIAAAAQIDQSYSPGGANVHSYLPPNDTSIGLTVLQGSPVCPVVQVQHRQSRRKQATYV